MSQRTAQLLETLRVWCQERRGRQTQVARILNVRPSTVSDWMSGRRQFTGEQALAVSDFLRTVYAHREVPTERLPSTVLDDPLAKLHAGLEDQDKKNVWVRTVGPYHHVILGGRDRDEARSRLLELVKKDRK
jgi:predicted XRE-type DNA-binding protein